MSEQLTTVPALYSSQFYDDPYPTYAAMRERGPAHRVRLPNGLEVWLVTGYQEARAALADPRLSKDPQRAFEVLSLARVAIFDETGASLARHMLNTDPPDHTRLRRLVAKAFTPRRVESLRPRVQQITDELLDACAAQDTADLIDAFAFPLPITVICELLGVPADDRDCFRTWSTRIVTPAFDEEGRGAVLTALAELNQYLAAFIGRKRREPGDDLMSALIAARDGADGGQSRLDEAELVSMAFLLLVAGHETTVNLIGNGVLALLREPDQLERLRGEPGLLPSAIEEFLRYDGPVETATFRFATEDVDFGGVVIPAGSVVSVVLASADRDPGRYADAERLDITRQDNAHLAFGHGIHYCLGAPLARLEGEIAIGTLLRRFPGLRLAMPYEELRWRLGTLMRGLHELPVAGLRDGE